VADVKRMVEQPSVQKGGGLTRAQMYEQATQSSKSKVKRMVDVEAVQAEAKGKKLNPSEFEKRAKEQAESKVKRMVDMDSVQAEARGKKLDPSEFERKVKEESEAKIKRMVDVELAQAEARGNVVAAPPPKISEPVTRSSDNEREASSTRAVTEVTVQATIKSDEDADSERLARLEKRRLERESSQKAVEEPKKETPVCKSYASGVGLRSHQVKLNDYNVFTVYTRDDNDQKMSLPLDNLKINISGPVSPQSEIFDNSDCSFDIEWIPTVAGVYTIDVTVDNVPVKDSPFVINLSQE